ncbi:hypothetical protein [Nonomuraea sp. LPB2021202275-12-8]|uniref:hypothetical protein n=1 Tax=Nonomuraea sp. LPB2021202275-12-8 TaxID=3120159 RepID=UPI00300C0E8B
MRQDLTRALALVALLITIVGCGSTTPAAALLGTPVQAARLALLLTGSPWSPSPPRRPGRSRSWRWPLRRSPSAWRAPRGRRRWPRRWPGRA